MASQTSEVTATQLRSVASVTTVNIAGSSLPVAAKLKSLGVIVDSHVRFNVHAREDAKSCNHHIRALRHVCKVLSDETVQTIACSIVFSRLDYCNAILYCAPESSLDKLQRTRNNLARVVCRRSRFTDARPLLQSLHWLKILYKTALLIYKTQRSATPTYLTPPYLLQLQARQLRSVGAALLSVPRPRTVSLLATRAFSVEATRPTVRNTLLCDVRPSGSADTFEKKLKTALFSRPTA